MVWQDDEKAARFIWSHLKRNNQWQIMFRSLETNIFVIRFTNNEDKNVILFGGAWNFDGYLIVLRDWHPSIPYQTLNFNTSPFWLEFKYLLPEFTYLEILYLFGNTMGDTVVVEPDGITPTTSSKFRALIMIRVTTPLITGIHAINVAEVSRWVGFFFAKQPYKVCVECKVLDHNTDLCGNLKTRRLIMEETVKKFGPEVELVTLPERNSQEIAQLFLQHGHQRR